jgi:hypothetical protein
LVLLEEVIALEDVRPATIPSFDGINVNIVSIEMAAFAVAGIRPRRRQWGALSCQSFLQVLSDVTSWALTHFEPVRAWSAAEDLTPIERSEGLKLVGRQQRLMAGQRQQANPSVLG